MEEVTREIEDNDNKQLGPYVKYHTIDNLIVKVNICKVWTIEWDPRNVCNINFQPENLSSENPI